MSLSASNPEKRHTAEDLYSRVDAQTGLPASNHSSRHNEIERLEARVRELETALARADAACEALSDEDAAFIRAALAREGVE